MIRSNELGTAGVHITEVLNNLSMLGHSIICADGQRYSIVDEITFRPNSGQRQSLLWKRITKSVETLHMQGEAFILWAFWKELGLLFSALITSLRHNPEVIYARRTYFDTAYFLSRLLQIPLVNEENGLNFDEMKMLKFGDSFSLRIIDQIERFSLPRADKVIAVTARMGELLYNTYKIPFEKIVVIENGANINLFKPMASTEARNNLNLNQICNYICFVGMLVQWQGVEYIIEAMPYILEKCPNTQLLIIGDGQMKEKLVELAEQVGVSDKVIFIGMVAHHRIPLFINACDLCVVPKKPMRTGYSPLKLYEYMACEKPVIATKTNGFEILEENNAGIVVNPENSQEFANATIRLLNSPELRKQMGRNGRRYVVDNRSWESVAKRVAAVCESAISERKPKR